MSREGPPSFQFYPRDWIVDTRKLTRDQRCRYHDALCESWVSGSYGVAAEDQWRDWLDYTPEQWDLERSAFVRLFSVREDGQWVQKRMVEVREEQLRRYERSQAGAELTNQRRWGDRVAIGERSGGGRSAVTPASASAFALENLNTNPPSPLEPAPSGRDGVPVRRKSRKPPPEHPDFPAFYSAYPRHEAPRRAASAFAQALKRHPSYKGSDLIQAAELFAGEKAGKDPEFLPYPASWLNADSFRKYFDEEEPDVA
jgi:uncharacterized protein YdaU (DUF1376 family)